MAERAFGISTLTGAWWEFFALFFSFFKVPEPQQMKHKRNWTSLQEKCVETVDSAVMLLEAGFKYVRRRRQKTVQKTAVEKVEQKLNGRPTSLNETYKEVDIPRHLFS